MATDVQSQRSRRAILTAAFGAAAAALASSLGRPSPAKAASAAFDSADSLIPAVKGSHTGSGQGAAGAYGLASATTGEVHGVIGDGRSPSGSGVYGANSAATGAAYGVRGESASSTGRGIYGRATSTAAGALGVGAFGRSDSEYGFGVYGQAVHPTGNTFGVVGKSDSPNGQGVRGEGVHLGVVGVTPSGATDENIGVWGLTVSSLGRGVQGSAQGTAGGYGVWGASDGTGGTGVFGAAQADAAARGVHGFSPAGQGVRGEATSGVGLYGTSLTGFGLRTSGRVRFDRISGVATIAAGATSSSVVTPGIDITSSNYVLLTPQRDPGSRRIWAVLNTTTNTITIRTNATSSSSLRVAWLILG